MRKRYLSLILIFILSALLVPGCGKSKDSARKTIIQFAMNYDSKTGKYSGVVNQIPQGKKVYIIIDNNKPFNTKSIGISIYHKEGQNLKMVSGTSTVVKPKDTAAIVPIAFQLVGKYQLVFKFSDKEGYQKAVTVI